MIVSTIPVEARFRKVIRQTLVKGATPDLIIGNLSLLQKKEVLCFRLFFCQFFIIKCMCFQKRKIMVRTGQRRANQRGTDQSKTWKTAAEHLLRMMIEHTDSEPFRLPVNTRDFPVSLRLPPALWIFVNVKHWHAICTEIVELPVKWIMYTNRKD